MHGKRSSGSIFFIRACSWEYSWEPVWEWCCLSASCSLMNTFILGMSWCCGCGASTYDIDIEVHLLWDSGRDSRQLVTLATGIPTCFLTVILQRYEMVIAGIAVSTIARPYCWRIWDMLIRHVLNEAFLLESDLASRNSVSQPITYNHLRNLEA